MAYARNNLISRSGYAGVGDFWDDIGGGAKAVLDFYNRSQQSAGAAAAAAQTNRDLAAALAAQQGGISTTTLLLLGVAGLGAVLLLKK
jgi:hypothetical protein